MTGDAASKRTWERRQRRKKAKARKAAREARVARERLLRWGAVGLTPQRSIAEIRNLRAQRAANSYRRGFGYGSFI